MTYSNHVIFILFTGIVLGLILMASIYNIVLYYYHKKKMFLYYALMQMGMMHVLFYDTGIVSTLFPSQNTESLFYYSISLYTLFFILLFTRTFLNTHKYLPAQDKIIQYLLLFILVDACIYPISFIFDFGLYFFIFIYIIILGYKCMKRHYKPAKFFFIGWSAFTISTVLDGIIGIDLSIKPYTFNPMFIGVIVEAIALAFAISFQFKELRIEQEKQKQLLIHQSKLALLGEMLGNISHQWRQPLTRLSYTLMNIGNTDNKTEKEVLIEEASKQLEFMSHTIDDFRDFYLPGKEQEYFSIAGECQEVLALMHFGEIEIMHEVKNDSTVYNYKNEFKQVLINLLSNAKDILLERMTVDPKIRISIDKHIIQIEDNAGGIRIQEIERIFEPYFSTKENGMGIGLYMSKLIIEKKIKGQLTVENSKNGAIFSIYLSRITDQFR